MKKIWKTSVVVTLAVMAFSGCGKAEAFAYKQFDNIQFTCALEEGAGQGISVGGQTGMRIQEDGSFSASYYAMDTEDTGEDYQGGTMYYGSGFGQIAEPVRVDDYTYKAKVESITYSEAGEESLQGGMRMVYTEVYGLEEAEEFMIYLPGKKVTQLPEAYIEGVKEQLCDENGNMPETLPFYGIFNESTETGFVGEEIDNP